MWIEERARGLVPPLPLPPFPHEGVPRGGEAGEGGRGGGGAEVDVLQQA